MDRGSDQGATEAKMKVVGEWTMRETNPNPREHQTTQEGENRLRERA